MARLPLKIEDLRKLFAFSGNRCAFPGCDHPLINSKGTFVAQVCHIEGVRGERYNPKQTDEDRRNEKNLILLCYRHHKETDNEKEFTVAKLKRMKSSHEKKFTTKYSIPTKFEETILTDIENQLSELFKLNEEIKNIVTISDQKLDLLLQFIPKPSIEESKIHISQIESIKELKKLNKYTTAIQLLQSFKEKNWNTLSDELKYKTVANIGVLYFDIRDNKKASETLVELIDIPYESEEKNTLLALAYSLQKDEQNFNIYFERTLNYNYENVNAWHAYIFLYGLKDKFDKSKIPSSILNRPEILIDLGVISIRNGDKKEGMACYNKALNLLKESNQETLELKANIASNILVELVDPFKYLHKSYSEEEIAELQNCKNLLTDFWDIIKETELSKSAWFTLMNRGIVNKIMGFLDNALLDLQRAFDLSNQFLAYKNLFLLYLQLGKYELAEQSLLVWENIYLKKNEDETFDIALLKSRLWGVQNKSEECIKQLLPYAEDLTNKHNFYALCYVIAILIENNLLDSAVPYVSQLLINYPTKIESHSLAGLLACQQNNKDLARKHYNDAFNLIDVTSSTHEIYELATGFINVDEFEKAALLFERITDKNTSTDLSRSLIYTYYQAGKISTALALAEGLFENSPESPFLAEIIINILSDVKDYENALTIAEKYLKVVPPKFKDLFCYRTALIYLYKREWGKVRGLINQIVNPLGLSFIDAFNLANMFCKVEEKDKGLELAYDLRTLYYDKKESHERYISLCVSLHNENESELFPEKVLPGCAIVMQNSVGEEKVFIISDKESQEATVLHSESKFAKQLIGKCLGEKVEYSQKLEVEQEYNISLIFSKESYAFRKSMDLLATRFAGETSFRVYNNDEKDPASALLDFIKQVSLPRQQIEEKIMTLYNSRQATIGVLASALKQNAVLQWIKLASSSSSYLYCNSQNEHESILELDEIRKPVVIDLITLLTVFFIYKSSFILDNLQNPKYVSQATIDELQSYWDDLESESQNGSLTVDLIEGALATNYTQKEHIQQHRNILQSIITWCKANSKIEISKKLIEFDRAKRYELSNTLHASFFETILLAEQINAIVISDDDTFKGFIKSQYNIKGLSTVQWAVHLTKKKILDLTTLEYMFKQLISSNYVFIPVNSEILWNTFETSRFKICKPFTVAVKGLLILNAEAAAIHTVNFIKKLYLNNGLSMTRSLIIIYVLTDLSTHVHFETVKKIAILKTKEQFQLMGIFGDELIKILQTF
jgi:hypothetical protein